LRTPANFHACRIGAAFLSGDLSGLADRDTTFRPPTGRGDEFAHGTPGRSVSRDPSRADLKSRDIFVPDMHIDTLKIKSRNFR